MLRIIRFLIGQEKLNKIAFDSLKPKPKEFTNLEQQFIDSKGRKYYKYYDIFNCSLDRKEQLTTKLTELNARCSVQDLDQMFLLIKKSIDDGFKGSDYAGFSSFLIIFSPWISNSMPNALSAGRFFFRHAFRIFFVSMTPLQGSPSTKTWSCVMICS